MPKQLSAWNKLVKEVYHKGKKTNKKYSFKEALKSASKLKKSMKSMSKSMTGGDVLGKTEVNPDTTEGQTVEKSATKTPTVQTVTPTVQTVTPVENSTETPTVQTVTPVENSAETPTQGGSLKGGRRCKKTKKLKN